MSFGSATAGIFGIFLLIRLIKIVIDTAIHGYALHTAYGCGMHLLGALWSSITHLLLHLARGPVNRDEKQSSDDSIAANRATDPTENQQRAVNAVNQPTCPIEDQPHRTELSSVVTTPNTYTYYDLSQRLDEVSQIPRLQRNLS